jgi:hypothetical protein
METLRRLHWRSFHPSTRHLVSLGAIALVLGIAGGAEFLASAHDGPQHDGLQAVPHLRTTIDAAIGEEASFLAENDAAMKKMMNDMTVKPSGDVDRDFVAMMRDRHGARGASLRPQRADQAHCPGDHRHSATGDRRYAPCRRRSPAAISSIADPASAQAGARPSLDASMMMF